MIDIAELLTELHTAIYSNKLIVRSIASSAVSYSMTSKDNAINLVIERSCDLKYDHGKRGIIAKYSMSWRIRIYQHPTFNYNIEEDTNNYLYVKASSILDMCESKVKENCNADSILSSLRIINEHR